MPVVSENVRMFLSRVGAGSGPSVAALPSPSGSGSGNGAGSGSLRVTPVSKAQYFVPDHGVYQALLSAMSPEAQGDTTDSVGT